MLKKQIKIKGTANRTELVEFLVSKRVKFLEYMKDLHSENGTLWMNCVHLDRISCGRHFGVNEECLTRRLNFIKAKNEEQEEEEEEEEEQQYEFKNGKEVRIPVEPLYKVPRDNVVNAKEFNSTSTINKSNQNDNDDDDSSITVNLNALPPRKNGSESIGKWQTEQLPLFSSLAFALSDLISASSMSGIVFIDSLYMLWLEIEVAFASNAAAKMLALRHLHQFRMHACRALRESLNLSSHNYQEQEREQHILNETSDMEQKSENENINVNTFSSSILDDKCEINVTNTKAVNSVSNKMDNNYFIKNQSNTNNNNNNNNNNIPRYLFLKHHQPHLCYSHLVCSHDMLIPSLCELLIFLYRRMCDYEVMNDSTMVKRIVSCDKKIMKWVIGPLMQEINLAAQRQLLEEMYVLSSGGLFNELNEITNTTIFNQTKNKNGKQSICNADKVRNELDTLSVSNDKIKDKTEMNVVSSNSLIDALWQVQNETQSVSTNDENNLEEDYNDDEDDDEDILFDEDDLKISGNTQNKRNNNNNNTSNNVINLPTIANRKDTNTRMNSMIELDDVDDAFVV